MKNFNPIIFGLSILSLATLAQAKEVTIRDAEYIDKEVIATKILNECTELPAQFTKFTELYLKDRKWAIAQDGEVSLKLYIKNAVSAGNAWSGHKKSVTIKAELYKDGELIDTYVGTRDSGGGFGAGFKGSCKVLARCVKTLGKDVSKWLTERNLS